MGPVVPHDVPSGVRPLIEWGAVSRSKHGESATGDANLIVARERCTLAALIDGLGHGHEAAIAASLAVATLERGNCGSIIELVRSCHRALIGTRGAAMTLAEFNATDDSLTWLSIGNVEGLLVRANHAIQPARETTVKRGGVVGYELPPLRASVVALSPGDTLILASDGVGVEFADQHSIALAPQEQADHILATYGKHTDDASVLVARYLGRQEVL